MDERPTEYGVYCPSGMSKFFLFQRAASTGERHLLIPAQIGVAAIKRCGKLMYRIRCQPTRSRVLSSFVVLAQKFPSTFRFT